MILSRDLQEILEGVHYFLSETLSQEPLPGKVECLRRGLVLQLEALVLSYPTLRIRARSSVSLPYLAMDQGPNQVINRLSESLSSNSSVTYSNSSSGDGLVLGSGRGGCDEQQQQQLLLLHQQQRLQQLQQQQQQLQQPSDSQSVQDDEEYEDFQDSKETTRRSSENTTNGGVFKDDDGDDNEDVYMETMEVVPFSTAIASCDKHGVLAKKTKGLLRNMKNYQCVAANGMLYLYLKETDERQRKTIDLTGYMARIATGDDIRDQRKRDAAFEIVGPGKKTHTFIARTARDRNEWLTALGRTIQGGRSKTLPSLSSLSSLSGLFGNISTDVNTLILPPKAPPPAMPVTQKTNDVCKAGEEDFYYHDVADDAKEEVYEVVGPEGTVFGKPVGTSESLPSRPAPQPPPCQSGDLQDYDPVSPEDAPPPLPECPPPSSSTASSSIRPPPPERPPLPIAIQERVNRQAARPLPDAPKDVNYNSYDPGGIYCEIEEDFTENEGESEYKNFSGETCYANRSNVGVDQGKKPRAVSADGLPQDSGSLSPTLSSRASTNSLVGSFSDEILLNMNISDPNMSQQTPHKYSVRPLAQKTPPKLPPKGIPLPPVDDDDSEYKVPTSSVMDVEYQIPPNPVPTEAETESSVRDISGPIPSASQLYQVPPSQTIVPIKPKVSDRRNSVIEEHSKPLSSFFSEREEVQSKNNLKTLTNKFERNDSSLGRELRDTKPSSQGTSVKDMIARLNKNKTVAENNSSGKTKETSINSGSNQVIKETAAGLSSTTNPPELKTAKPNLPPRPQNLLNKATVINKKTLMTEDQKSTVSDLEEEDDDDYETPEGHSFDSTSQQDVNGISSNDTAAPWKANADSAVVETSDATTGEWFVAKFAFVATIDQALSFSRGDLILVHDTASHSGWWKATVKGRSGVVPREYLKKKES